MILKQPAEAFIGHGKPVGIFTEYLHEAVALCVHVPGAVLLLDGRERVFVIVRVLDGGGILDVRLVRAVVDHVKGGAEGEGGKKDAEDNEIIAPERFARGFVFLEDQAQQKDGKGKRQHRPVALLPEDDIAKEDAQKQKGGNIPEGNRFFVNRPVEQAVLVGKEPDDAEAQKEIQRVRRRIGKNIPCLHADAERRHEPVSAAHISDKNKGEDAKKDEVGDPVIGDAVKQCFKKKGNLSGKEKIPGIIFQLRIAIAAVSAGNLRIEHVGREKVGHAVIEACLDVPFVRVQPEVAEHADQKDDETGASHDGCRHQGKPVETPGFILCKKAADKGKDAFSEKEKQAEQRCAKERRKKALSKL